MQLECSKQTWYKFQGLNVSKFEYSKVEYKIVIAFYKGFIFQLSKLGLKLAPWFWSGNFFLNGHLQCLHWLTKIGNGRESKVGWEQTAQESTPPPPHRTAVVQIKFNWCQNNVCHHFTISFIKYLQSYQVSSITLVAIISFPP